MPNPVPLVDDTPHLVANECNIVRRTVLRPAQCVRQLRQDRASTKRMSLVAYPNTRPMCSANCDGTAAAVVVSGSKLKALSLEQQRRAVKMSASILTTDPWEEACPILPDVNTLTRNAATQASAQADIGPACGVHIVEKAA
jgi:acetyl-CoA acetyltransferase